MEIVRSYDVRTGDADEDKYWGFVGEEWAWFGLTSYDVNRCEDVARARDKSRGGSQKNYAKGSSLEGSVHGFIAEMAASRFTGLKINQTTVLRDRNQADLGNDIEVKATRADGGWRIYVNESTMRDERRYVLVSTCFFPKYVAVMGWIYGHEINEGPQEMKFRKDERAYWKSWHSLRTMGSFDASRLSLE